MNPAWPLPDPDAERAEVAAQVGDALAVRLAAVRLLILDCDGIMTAGKLVYGADGETLKEFDARDGLGLMMLWAGGVARAVLTGRTSLMVERRCTELKFEAIRMGRFDKQQALEEIWAETGATAAETLYMGDDLLDLPTLVAAGVAVTVPGAPDEVRAVCDHVTTAAGGDGAVREVCDLLLKSRGGLAAAITALAGAGRPADDPEVTH